jgi:hypothetical protein
VGLERRHLRLIGVDDQRDRFDPLEDVQPRPLTFTQRRIVAVVGGLAILLAVGVLIRALGTSAVPVSAADELSATTHRRPAGDRAGDRASERADERPTLLKR